MLIFLLVFIIICLYNIKFNFKNNLIHDDYISKEKSTSIKGIFIVLILFSHFNGYINYTYQLDNLYNKIIGLFGQIVVVCFLFYSGYGVMESIKKKGKTYVNSIPFNRVMQVWVEFSISMVIALIVQYILGYEITVRDISLSLFALQRIGYSSWYVFAILILYVITYIAFRISIPFSRKINEFKLRVLFTIILTIGYIAIMQGFKARHWYDTVLCYPIGMLWSLYRNQIEKICQKIYLWIIAVGIVGIMTVMVKMSNSDLIIYGILSMILSCLFIILITMRVSISNKILNWFGQHLFEIYLLHRIPMMICESMGVMNYNPYISFTICIASTLFLAFVFKKGYQRLWNCIKESQKSKLLKD